MRSAFLDQVRSEDIPFNRELDVQSQSRRAILEAQTQSYVIDTIMSSVYGSDFIRSNFAVVVDNTSPDGLTLKISYKDPVDDGIVEEDFSLKGGVLDLPLNPHPGYEPTFKSMICHEDIIVESATDVLSTASLVDGFCAVCPSGSQPRIITVSEDISKMDQDSLKRIERSQVTEGQDSEGNAFREVTSEIIGAISPIEDNVEATLQAVFLRSLLRDLTADDLVIDVTDLRGNISAIEYDSQAEDYIIVFAQSDPVISVRCSVIASTAKSIGSRVEDVITHAERRLYPFEFDWVRSPRIVLLDRALEPGVYTLYYKAKVPVQYDASMENA
jgi:hypothetical protein